MLRATIAMEVIDPHGLPTRQRLAYLVRRSWRNADQLCLALSRGVAQVGLVSSSCVNQHRPWAKQRLRP